jgi:hypothetical protein
VSVTEDALALAFRSGLPFVGLRDHAHDPDLDRLIPPDVARTARAIPLAADDDHIRLAVADPDTDLSPLERYLAGRQVDLALAPREEIDTILGPPPPPGEEPPEAATEEPDPLAADGAAAIATDEPVAAAEPEPVAAAEPEPAAAAEPDAAAPPLAYGESEPERLAVEPHPLVAEPVSSPAGEGEPDALAQGEPETVVEAASPPEPEAVAVVAADDELVGEVPSWLEPGRRRWWRVVLTVLLVLVVLGLAAVAVVAFVNA